ncbi:hypothetical protein M3Y99_00216200 [Aphelenchoides fujianensis]|nr:hypothetical protein M3Y99_00216200 [Aphelenchoides fujianensis]
MSAPTGRSEAKERGCCPNSYRFLILALTSACLTSICSNMIAFNVTMLCDNAEEVNGTAAFVNDEQNRRDTLLIWAVAVGSILATFPFNLLYARFGARFVFAAAGTISFLSTALIPVASMLGIVPFVAVRFLQLCTSSLGWHSVFYVHAAVGPVLFGLWFFLYSDFPERHPRVSAAEKQRIMEGKNVEHRELDGFIPYREICTNRVILVVWFNAFGDIISAIFLLTYFPKYLTDVLGYSLRSASLLSMLPAISHIPSKLAFGWIFDKTR